MNPNFEKEEKEEKKEKKNNHQQKKINRAAIYFVTKFNRLRLNLKSSSSSSRRRNNLNPEDLNSIQIISRSEIISVSI